MSSIDSFSGRAPGEVGLGQLLAPPSSHFLANRETSDIFSQLNLSRLLSEMHAYGMASYSLIAMDVKVKSLTSSFHSIPQTALLCHIRFQSSNLYVVLSHTAHSL